MQIIVLVTPATCELVFSSMISNIILCYKSFIFPQSCHQTNDPITQRSAIQQMADLHLMDAPKLHSGVARMGLQDDKFKFELRDWDPQELLPKPSAKR